MSHEDLESLAAVYAVGALDGADLAAFEAHLAEGCAACEAALRGHAETLAALAASEVRTIPPAESRTALLRRLDATAPRTAAPSRRTWTRWAIGTAAAVVAASWLTGMYVAARYEAHIGELVRETTAMRQRLAGTEAILREQVAGYASVAELLRDPATRVVTLRGLTPSPNAIGRVVWNAERGGVIFVSNLPTTPAGKTYELWTIAGGAPRPAGTFDVDTDGKASHRMTASGAVDVFAVTLEPTGGVPAPTGPMMLASK